MAATSIYYETFDVGPRTNENTNPPYRHGVTVELQRLEIPSKILFRGFTTYIMTVAVSFKEEQETLKHIQLDFKSDAEAIRHAIDTFDRNKKIIEQRLQLQEEA